MTFNKGDKVEYFDGNCAAQKWLGRGGEVVSPAPTWTQVRWNDGDYATVSTSNLRLVFTPAPAPAVPAIDWSKLVRLKSTQETLRVLCTDAPGIFSVVCLLTSGLIRCTKDGTTSYSSGVVVENIPPEPVSATETILLYRAKGGKIRVLPAGVGIHLEKNILGKTVVTIKQGDGM